MLLHFRNQLLLLEVVLTNHKIIILILSKLVLLNQIRLINQMFQVMAILIFKNLMASIRIHLPLQILMIIPKLQQQAKLTHQTISMILSFKNNSKNTIFKD